MTALPVPLEDTDIEAVMTLEERAQRIMGVLERTAIEIGQELLDAKADHPGRFTAWVEQTLPFGIDRAERLMAITRAFATVDPAVRSALPPAWSALYELTRLPSERFARAIEIGTIHPDMTVIDARTLRSADPEPMRDVPPPYLPIERKRGLTTDLVARELLRLPREDLDPGLDVLLREWLQGP